MLHCAKWLLITTAVSIVALQSAGQDGNYVPDHLKQDGIDRTGKDLLDLIGLGTGADKDPYVAKTNSACLNGDLAECFKSHALNSLDDFFTKAQYRLTDNARIIRMPSEHLRALAHQPFEYSSEPRADEPEWDQFVKFLTRKVEKFLKSTAIEVQFPEEVTERGRYSPRFVDEIADEIDIIEDKKDTLFSRKRLRKLFIPFLIIVKLFKLKLLLFLPLILGIASFKKLLGFLAIIIPGLIGFFKLCKPNLGTTSFHSDVPAYSPAGIGIHHGSVNYHHHVRDPVPSFASPDYYGHGGSHSGNYGGSYGGSHNYYNGGSSGVSFREDPQYLAYNGYSEYRNAKTVEKTAKKSILPDS